MSVNREFCTKLFDDGFPSSCPFYPCDANSFGECQINLRDAAADMKIADDFAYQTYSSAGRQDQLDWEKLRSKDAFDGFAPASETTQLAAKRSTDVAKKLSDLSVRLENIAYGYRLARGGNNE